jgi:hypothetical protein
MNRSKTTRRVVEALVDPDPVFVSLVARGANQTPFKFIKQDDQPTTEPPNAPPMKPKTPEGTAKKADETSLASLVTKEVDIERIEFAKTDYPDTAAVETFLKANSYSDVEIEDAEGVWVVRGIDASAFESVSSMPVPAADGTVVKGVTAFLGKLKKSAEAQASSEPPAGGDDDKSKEQKADGLLAKDGKALVAKYDHWTDLDFGAPTVSEIIAARSADGMPPGVYEIFDSLREAIVTAIRSGNTSAVPSRCSEAGDLIVRTAALFSGLSAAGFQKEAEALVSPPAATEQKGETHKKSEEPTAPGGLDEKSVDALIAKALAPLLEQIKGLETKQAETVKKSEAQEAQAEELKGVREAVTKAEDRLLRLERSRLARKSSGTGSDGTQIATSPTGGEGDEPPRKLAKLSKAECRRMGVQYVPSDDEK